ncbi:MAG: aldo/keto reductase [Clostridia bacterium]|nr:aldo/keto reductase [Clostridia bacterium]
MELRKFPGTDISASVLGMGCMRLPVLDEENHPIDEEKAIKMIRAAIDGGVTYVDTAYGYHNGKSEVVVGKALKDGYREKVTLTSKLPLWLVEKREDMERLLDEQLKRLEVEYLDFYLAHAVSSDRFDKVVELGLFEFLDEMIAKGKIRYPGFSFHDNKEVFIRVIDSYPWKLAQVQMNILDEFNQATMEGIEYAKKKGIGVVIMEPLRGGALTQSVPAEILKLYDEFKVKRSPAEWAFRYLYDRDEIVTILSGMSTMEQIEDNLKIFESAKAGVMEDQEKELLKNVRLTYEARVRIGCTGCSYCQPCPQEIKIPQIFKRYDTASMFNDLKQFYARYGEKPAAERCVECGSCESACPQNIKIRDWIKTIDREYRDTLK